MDTLCHSKKLLVKISSYNIVCVKEAFKRKKHPF